LAHPRQAHPVWQLEARSDCQGCSTPDTCTYTYDPADNLLSAANGQGAYALGYDALNRRTSAQQPFGVTQTFAYDAAGNRTLAQDSLGGTTTSTYDALNRLQSRQFGGAQPLRVDLTYTATDRLQTLVRSSDLAGMQHVGSTSYSYDALERVATVQHRDASGMNLLANYTYTYDIASRLTSETLNGGPPTNYSYDDTNQLTNDGTTAYTRDLNGNRTLPNYQTGPGNRLLNDGTWTYTYDNAGNLTGKATAGGGEIWTYTYDHHNHLVSAMHQGGAGPVQATYSYDALDNRVEKDVSTGGAPAVTKFAYDGSEVLADLDSGNSLQRRYLHGDLVDQVFARLSAGGMPTAAWYLPDRQGSVRDLTDETGAVQDHLNYDGFGKASETNPTFGDRYKYTAREYDSETGLQYNRARYYDATIGRWTSEDPQGFAAGDANLYRYVGNNPPNRTDPRGLEASELDAVGQRYAKMGPQERALFLQRLSDSELDRLAGMAMRQLGADAFREGQFGLRSAPYPSRDLAADLFYEQQRRSPAPPANLAAIRDYQLLLRAARTRGDEGRGLSADLHLRADEVRRERYAAQQLDALVDWQDALAADPTLRTAAEKELNVKDFVGEQRQAYEASIAGLSDADKQTARAKVPWLYGTYDLFQPGLVFDQTGLPRVAFVPTEKLRKLQKEQYLAVVTRGTAEGIPYYAIPVTGLPELNTPEQAWAWYAQFGTTDPQTLRPRLAEGPLEGAMGDVTMILPTRWLLRGGMSLAQVLLEVGRNTATGLALLQVSDRLGPSAALASIPLAMLGRWAVGKGLSTATAQRFRQALRTGARGLLKDEFGGIPISRGAKAPTKLTPGSAEHKALRWQEYQQRGGSWSYERWSKQYEVNMQNATGPLLREAEYRAALGGENRILNTPLGQRQIDILVAGEKRAVQLKTGYEYLTTTGRLNNADAIARDAWLVKQGYTVEWVLEKGGSQPLLDALKEAGIKVHTGPLIK
jgi:RHS repeat-associated protein